MSSYINDLYDSMKPGLEFMSSIPNRRSYLKIIKKKKGKERTYIYPAIVIQANELSKLYPQYEIFKEAWSEFVNGIDKRNIEKIKEYGKIVEIISKPVKELANGNYKSFYKKIMNIKNNLSYRIPTLDDLIENKNKILSFSQLKINLIVIIIIIFF